MGRWLPKEEREERDKKVINLYQLGLTYGVIIRRFGLSGDNAVSAILKRHGVTTNRTGLVRR